MRLTLACCVLMMAACSSPSDPPKPALTYPVTTMGDVVDDYHGTRVPDPYRWMENLDSPEVAAWVKAENAVTDSYLASLPHRTALNERLTALWNYPRVGTPLLEAGRLFYRKNAGLQRQSPIYMRASADAPPALVIDPNVISEGDAERIQIGYAALAMIVKVLVISGSMGAGKTTVLGEASDVLAARAIPHAAIDLDAVAAVLLPDESMRRLATRNLTAVFENFVSAGIQRVLLAVAVESRGDLQTLSAAMSNPELVVCRLLAPPETMEHRIRLREPGMHQEAFVARSRALDAILSAARVEDFTTLNAGGDISDVALDMLQRAGWIS